MFCCNLGKGNRITVRHQLNRRKWLRSRVYRYLTEDRGMERIRKIRSKRYLGVREANVEKGASFTQKWKAAQEFYRKLVYRDPSMGL